GEQGGELVQGLRGPLAFPGDEHLGLCSIRRERLLAVKEWGVLEQLPVAPSARRRQRPPLRLPVGRALALPVSAQPATPSARVAFPLALPFRLAHLLPGAQRWGARQRSHN